jgi:hypothetical protein
MSITGYQPGCKLRVFWPKAAPWLAFPRRLRNTRASCHHNLIGFFNIQSGKAVEQLCQAGDDCMLSHLGVDMPQNAVGD